MARPPGMVLCVLTMMVRCVLMIGSARFSLQQNPYLGLIDEGEGLKYSVLAPGASDKDFEVSGTILIKSLFSG